MYTHTFELPLYEDPPRRFKKLLKDLGNPLIKQCMASYWQEKLTFSSNELDESGRKVSVSVVPVSSNMSARKLKQVTHDISLFASKFNASMALRGNDMEVSLELLTDISDTSRYGKGVKSVLRFSVFIESVAKKIALESFFSVVDSSSR